MKSINDEGGLGVTAAILLISFILIAATAVSVLNGGTVEITEEDAEEMLNEVLDEITTYIQIKDTIGKYDPIDGEQEIQKIAILIKPLVSVDIDVSTLTVKISNGEQIKILYYNGQAEFIESNSLFGHPIWNTIDINSYSIVVTLDKDRSLVDYNTINKNTDMAYIILKLPEEFTMKKGDTLTITLFPSTGLTKIIDLEAPLPINQVVTLL